MKIATGCAPLDDLLDGGIETGCITLLFGEAGTGKTNLCLQLARNVVRGGQNVAYIDTEGVSLERLRQICGEDYQEVLQGLLLTKVYTLAEQETHVEKSVTLATKTENVGLVVLDAATTHYRLTSEENRAEERHSLTRQITALMGLARKRDIPVLVVSQVYTDLDTGRFEPLGGHMMTHNAKDILRLEKAGGNVRLAVVVKHRHLPEGAAAKFQISEDGLA